MVSYYRNGDKAMRTYGSLSAGLVARVLAVFCCSILGATAQASTITWSGSGEVVYVDTVLSSYFTLGQAGSSSLTFDTSSPGSGGNYPGAVISSSISIGAGAYSGTATGPGVFGGNKIDVFNDINLDAFFAYSGSTGPGALGNGWEFWQTSWNVRDVSEAWLSS